MIRNPDGSEYKVTCSMQQFDPYNPDQDLFNVWDSEAIRIGGSPIFYHELFIQPQGIDPVYKEDRSKLWSPFPVQLYCIYNPLPNQNALGPWGVDAPDEMIFEFNYRDVLRTINHPPIVGSYLYTPHKGEFWEIKQRNDGGFKLWGQLRLQLICQKFQESPITGEGKVKQPQPDFKINTGSFLATNQFDRQQTCTQP